MHQHPKSTTKAQGFNYTAVIGRQRREKHSKPAQGRQKRFKMGQEQSSPVDESVPPQTLEDRSVESVAKYIRDGHAKKIVVMVGLSSYTRGYWLTTYYDMMTGRGRRQHLRRHSRLPITRHRAVLQFSQTQSTLSRSSIRHILFPRQPASVLHFGA